MTKSNSGRRDWRRSAAFVFLPALVMLLAGIFLLVSASAASAISDARQPHVPLFRSYDYPATQLANPTVPWVVVNKQRPISPNEFQPKTLDTPSSTMALDNSRQVRLSPAPASAISELASAMNQETGAVLVLHSGFRSFAYQKELFAAKVQQYGQEVALIRSAKAGFSEHQTGLAVDVSALGFGCVIEQCFGETEPGIWIAENAWRFGFIIRYPADATGETGYAYEPWHLRYLGRHVAAEYRASGALTLEEFWGLPPAADYAPEATTESTSS